MLTGFEVKEIKRFYQQYREYTDNEDEMTLDTFLSIPPLDFNPLKDRIAIHFGFVKGKTEINFKEFVCGLSLFNAIGSRESKIKIAFQIQDFDEVLLMHLLILKLTFLTYIDITLT
jgi:Ca2+-binding EF-hand superfamily protein